MQTIKERKNKINTDVIFSETPPFPYEIYLDLTSFCNHKCVFCANKFVSNKSFMKKDMAARVIQEAYECGTREIGLYATGEPFLVKNLPEYVKLAKQIGYEYVFVTTNGALATPDRVKPVLDAGLNSIKFSISAGTRETFKIVQGRDDFDKVLENLRWISNYRKESGLKYRIYVTMVYTHHSKEEIESLKKEVMPYIDEWDPHPINNQCGNMYENNELGPIEKRDPRSRGKRDICFQPFMSFTVTPDGLVSACVLDYSQDLIVADLHKTTLKEMWTSELYKEFRRRHLTGEFKGGICHNCMYNANEPVVPLMPEHKRTYSKTPVSQSVEDEHYLAKDDPRRVLLPKSNI